VINLDTNTAIGLIAEDSPIRYELREVIGDQKMVMTQTAFNEFVNIVRCSGGDVEQERANRFFEKVTIVADCLSTAAQKLLPTRNLDVNDIIILGTGDQMGIVTMTADAKAIRAASAQGVDFNVYLHRSYSLTNK
jgi:predicted nucleic acid-binding protein